MEEQYKPQEIETNAQRYWHEKNCFQVVEDVNREKFYCLSMFPYPSGSLHMGHVRNYTIGDVIARYQYMLGKNVLQPMGWDAFGLPAENAAIKNNIPPAAWTRQNIQHIRGQMMRIGFAYDWSREITTCDPEYYRWEQWFFLRLFKKGLVYKKNAEVNWDPEDQTVLANEQVVNGRGWRSGALVERREIPQWFLKITAYAEELLRDLDKLEHWPQQVKTMQRNWIGRSEGVEITFPVSGQDPIRIYTTRPDTLYGVTYIAVAPQHPLTRRLAEHNPALKLFMEECRNIKVAEADIATMEKRGMPLGLTARHPLTGQDIPVWVANFVLMEYGSGALMAVPAHDQRDFEFAQKYGLPLKQVIAPADETRWDFNQGAYTEYGTLMDSAEFTGLTSTQAFNAVAAHLEALELGERKIQYRLRDWGVSRQRYWGTPIPIINCMNCGAVPVPDKDLPVILPEEVQFTGVVSPLKTMASFYKTTCPKCHEPAERETDTFDTFMESSWYYARFACKKQNKSMLDGRANYWLSVDQYVGGIEHAVLHLLYARFFHKLMRDEGLLNTDEPFLRLLSQGMVLNNGAKMSKSKGNVVDPQLLVDHYGADTVRLFMMFAAPPEQSLEWSDSGVEGAHRFLKRLWAYGYEVKDIIRKLNRLPKTNLLSMANWEKADAAQTEVFRQIYEILEQAKFDYERQQYNTVVSSCMKILNLLAKIPEADSDQIDIREIIIFKGFSILLRLLAPITPHITHQLWQDLNYEGIILNASWPRSSPIVFKVDTIELVVQVNGKLRSRVRVPHGANQEIIESRIVDDAKVQQAINGKLIKKIIIVPGKLANVVTGE
ncbi:Leucine--tRNA ligase [Aquicella siphonis]|uniref:Leucine--tRNA ligase n=1 Tax=Aquicella siphonis TaxID=254247 RepID=A0A5E4PIJ5_9COXI|nr:leucine--tRNA ligase [Aquicella siphonis]VVC76233.1 Leucine--tRNA ligase [Aquicella siphonis]